MHPKLFVGTAEHDFLTDASRNCLFLDDGSRVDAFLERFPRGKVFDFDKHHINPLQRIDEDGARDLADITYLADPGGDGTLTVRNGKGLLATLFLDHARLDDITGDRKDPVMAEALGMLDRALFSPLIRRVLCQPTNFSFKGSVIVPITPDIYRKDALLLALLFMNLHKGHIIVPDGGAYLRPLHVSLIRQNRVTCGVQYLPQLGPEDSILRQAVLGIQDKTGRGCTYKDASTLANYAGIAQGGTNPSAHTAFVNECM